MCTNKWDDVSWCTFISWLRSQHGSIRSRMFKDASRKNVCGRGKRWVGLDCECHHLLLCHQPLHSDWGQEEGFPDLTHLKLKLVFDKKWKRVECSKSLLLVIELAFISMTGWSIIRGPLMTVDSSGGWLVPCNRASIDPYRSTPYDAIPSSTERPRGVQRCMGRRRLIFCGVALACDVDLYSVKQCGGLLIVLFGYEVSFFFFCQLENLFFC